MSDLNQVLKLWQQIEATGEDCVLATVVHVDGSSYRKPCARMLITGSGIRAGTISGGCLEGEVCKQAWWLTAEGPVVRQYSTSFEMDEHRPYGLGCGGTVHLLLERRQNAEPFLRALQVAFIAREAMACAVTLSGWNCGKREVVTSASASFTTDDLRRYASEAFAMQRSTLQSSHIVWAEYIPARTGLFIFGAGDDAKPLVTQASTLGWHITVADGRSHLATRLRFPEADEVVVLERGNTKPLTLREGDAAVVMTHSYEQDRTALSNLLEMKVAYLGVLGPRYRTADLLNDIQAASPLAEANTRSREDTWNKVHSPVGLDLGGDSPATIALSILAEIQGILKKPLTNGASANALPRVADLFIAPTE